MNYILKYKYYRIISISVLIIFWTIVSETVDNSIAIPTPLETLNSLIDIIISEVFLSQVLNSIVRILISFLISLSLGLVLGILSGSFSAINNLLSPVILILRAIPSMAVILLSLIWLSREFAPILVGVLVIFPLIYSAVVDGILNVDKKLIEMVNIYKFSNKKKLFHLYLPWVRSSLVSVCAAAISLNVKVTIAAEVLSQPQYSIGSGFQMERVALNTAGILAWAIVAIVLAGILEKIVKILFYRAGKNQLVR